MNQFTRADAIIQQRELERALDKLGDDYTLAEFQQEVFRSTKLVVKPNADETVLSLHKSLSVKESQPHCTKFGPGMWGVTGTYVNKPVATISFWGHYNKDMMIAVKGVAKNIIFK